MLTDLLRRTEEPNRRQFLEFAAKSCLGVTAFPLLSQFAHAAPSGGDEVKAKNVIYLFMSGAMSHLDTFDMKKNSDVRGETEAIKTKVPGIQFGSLLPGLATHADKMAVINSMYTETGDHEGARYLMRTSYKEISSIRHPHMGAMAIHMHGRRNRMLPDNVVVNPEARHPAAGYLDPGTSPLPVGDPLRGLENTTAPDYLTEDSFHRRIDLINKFDKNFQNKFKQTKVDAYNNFYQQASTLLSSDELKVFDLSEEDQAIRDEYGMDRFGQGCLLARRLVEKNVRFVEVSIGGWDMHTDIYEKLPDALGRIDKSVSALLKDLEQRGLLKDTMVVLTTEFGRTPRINQNAGRDHHPAAFSSFLAGAGIKGGQVYGASDEEGKYTIDDPVAVSDFNATIATAMGLDLSKEIIAPNGRPFRVAHDGAPISKILA
ncbi:DUF1501 domain-containing protein [Rubinisphaera margarita]|uniref:DUF1501 domain-containing protein n=1 Tax=Rubinisphaera margarita TaxID=2909586 RepID=UPI001EE8C534|nr:DUF1501 domain-containing protein [Rubinisphaera margarita]MCG6154913.1 DUF1501 domain-containing protein [Rubinisphaera margarita]